MENFTEKTKSRIERIMGIVSKEIQSLLHDKMAIFILFLLPVTIILVLGLSSPNLENFSVTIWIIDQDDTQKSNEFIQTIRNSSFKLQTGKFLPKKVYSSGQLAPIEPKLGETEAFGNVSLKLAQEMISTDYLDAFIILPPGFEKSLADTGKTNLSIYLDAIDFQSMMISDYTILLGLTEVQLQNLLLESDVYYFPENRPDLSGKSLLDISSPAFIPLILFFTMQLISSQCIVGDIPLKRLLNSSLMRGEVIVGKIISYSFFAAIQILISLLILGFFNITLQTAWINLFILLFITSLSGICMGVFISTITKTRLQASQIFLLILITMFIIQNFVRKKFLLNILPLEQSSNAYNDIAFRGMDFGDGSVHLATMRLLGIGFFFFVLSVLYIKYVKKEFV
ncbi:MAG: ABC transporter permease [Promethearchaeota archaeon]